VRGPGTTRFRRLRRVRWRRWREGVGVGGGRKVQGRQAAGGGGGGGGGEGLEQEVVACVGLDAGSGETGKGDWRFSCEARTVAPAWARVRLVGFDLDSSTFVCATLHVLLPCR
jgi:hypothetical protein